MLFFYIHLIDYKQTKDIMKFSRKNIQDLRFIVQLIFMLGLFISFMPYYNPFGKYLFLPILIAGVFFCGWVCPFGALQDWTSKIARFFKLPRYQVPDRFQKYLQLSRYVFYALGILGISFAILNARHAFNKSLFSGHLTIVAGIILLIFILLSLFIDRPLCNYFCQKGACYGLLSVLRIFGISRDNFQCVHCKLCDKRCPMNIKIESNEFVRHPNCINCMTCVSVCPKKCINYKLFIEQKTDKISSQKK